MANMLETLPFQELVQQHATIKRLTRSMLFNREEQTVIGSRGTDDRA